MKDMKMNEPKDYVLKAFYRWCELCERKNFAGSRCLMPISIGQKVHEGEKLFSTLVLINRTFKECVLLVDDSIQRHTMQIDSILSTEDLYLETIKTGNEWLERNKSIYSLLTIPYSIIRWDKWLKHKNYQQQRFLIDNAYEEDFLYRQAFDESIREFLTRYQKQKGELAEQDYQKAFAHCLEYVKEECTALCLWVEEKCEFEVYPSGRNPAMIATYEKFVKPTNPNLLKSVSFYFKKHFKNNNFIPVNNKEHLVTS